MAKNTAPTPVTAAPPTEADTAGKVKKAGGRPAGFSTKDNDVIKAVDPQPTEKIAPQALTIANTVVAAGKNGLTRGALIENLKGVLTTRQPEGRILSYYQKLLVDGGFITITPGAPAAATAAPAAAAK